MGKSRAWGVKAAAKCLKCKPTRQAAKRQATAAEKKTVGRTEEVWMYEDVVCGLRVRTCLVVREEAHQWKR